MFVVEFNPYQVLRVDAGFGDPHHLSPAPVEVPIVAPVHPEGGGGVVRGRGDGFHRRPQANAFVVGDVVGHLERPGPRSGGKTEGEEGVGVRGGLTADEGGVVRGNAESGRRELVRVEAGGAQGGKEGRKGGRGREGGAKGGQGGLNGGVLILETREEVVGRLQKGRREGRRTERL